MPGVGADGIDGALMTLDLSYGGEVINVPHLQHASPTGTQQHGSPRNVCQSTHPVLMGVGDLLWRGVQFSLNIQFHLHTVTEVVSSVHMILYG